MNERTRRWDFDKRMRKNFIGALKATTRANEISEETERREWRERAETYLKRLSDARTSVVHDLSSTRCLLTDERRRWCKRLEGLDVSSSGAARELTDLLEEVKDKRQFWSLLGGEIQRPRLPAWLTASMPSPGRSQHPAAPSLNPVDLMLTQQAQERDREFTQQAQENECALASIVSSVEHLITLHQGYIQAHSRS
jgi:hypothetical protein